MATTGFKHVCIIESQSRLELSDLKVRKAQALHDKVGEIEERVTVEDYDLNPQPLDKNRELTDPELVRTASGEIIRILRKPNADIIRGQLQGSCPRWVLVSGHIIYARRYVPRTRVTYRRHSYGGWT